MSAAPRMLDVSLEIEHPPGAPRWRVHLRSVEGHDRTDIPPITDADLADVPDLPARSWEGLIAQFAPGAPLDLQQLRLLGEQIMKRVLAAPELREHLQRLELRQQTRHVPLRFLLEVENDGDALLADLPLELMHDGSGFVFRRRDRPALRCAPGGNAYNLKLGQGARALLVTAHADDPPHPSRDELAAHAQAVAQALTRAGYQTRILVDATAKALEAALLDEPVDLLYISCHGLENRREYGSLLLRDGPLSGNRLAEWLREKWRGGRPVQVVLLCACSSAVPQAERGTSGMAQWLARPGCAAAALGFRGPVGVAWALQFCERLFQHLGEGRSLEDAFARARSAADERDPQWVLPLLYGRPQDVLALEETRSFEPGRGAPAEDPDTRSSDPDRTWSLEADGIRAHAVLAKLPRFQPAPQVPRVDAALLGFCRDAFGSDEAPAAEAADARRLVAALRGSPLALALAAATLRTDDGGCAAYLAAWKREGPFTTGKDQRAWTLARLLAALTEDDRRLFKRLVAAGDRGTSARGLAATLGEGEMQAARRLDRLVRFHLLDLAEDGDRYSVNPLLRDAA